MIRDVVIDDYCEFNVQVFETTTAPPATFPRRSVVGIGTDSTTLGGGNLFGEAQEVDTGDGIVFDSARVWAGTYQVEAGGAGGALNGTNSTLQRWAFSIGGTAAHEAGHTYGLTHGNGSTVLPGEDAANRHLMPAGSTLTDEDRAGFRRHFGDTEFGILAGNVGLSLETIHNWDFTNPNSVTANQLRIDVLTTSSTLTLSWFFSGSSSPWTSPSMSGLLGTQTFKGTVYNHFQVTWSTGQTWSGGSAGQVPAGASFHVGAAFSEADFTVPDSVIVTAVTLLDGAGSALTLRPRMVGYNTGALDAADGTLDVSFFTIDDVARPLVLADLTVSELPRLASIDSMVVGGKLQSWQGLPIRPWKTERSLCDPRKATSYGRCTLPLREPRAISVAKLAQGRHIVQYYSGQCPTAVPVTDSTGSPDVNECPAAGVNLDLFPATTLYITATVIDPAAKHWDRASKAFVVGPVESHLFYQIAGRHPDLNRNGVDDYIDILRGRSPDRNRDGVPDETQHCLKALRELEAVELKHGNLQRQLAGVSRKEQASRATKESEAEREQLKSAEAQRREALRRFRLCQSAYIKETSAKKTAAK